MALPANNSSMPSRRASTHSLTGAFSSRNVSPCSFYAGNPSTQPFSIAISSQSPALEAFNIEGARGLACVIPGALFVGGNGDIHDSPQAVIALGVSAFLCVAADLGRPAYVSQADLDCGAVAFRHMPLADNGGTRFADHLPEAFAFIDAARAEGRAVAVYCQAGKSRSVSVVAAYLMREEEIDFGAAMERIRRTRTVADPNIHFCMQLQELTTELHHGSLAAAVAVSPSSRAATPQLGGGAGEAQRGSHRFAHQAVVSFAGKESPDRRSPLGLPDGNKSASTYAGSAASHESVSTARLALTEGASSTGSMPSWPALDDASEPTVTVE
jgi:hypothetical protein